MLAGRESLRQASLGCLVGLATVGDKPPNLVFAGRSVDCRQVVTSRL